MASWTIPFQSINGTNYVVRILGADTDTELIPAADPITTQEDDDDDFFTPVRTQSGYVRFVDTNNEWEKIFPLNDTARKVSLEQNGQVVWQGYLQPQTFQGELFVNTQTRELPIMCPISILEGVDVRTDVLTIKNFAYLINEIFTSTGYDWTFVFPGSSSTIVEWLSYQIDWVNFLNVKDDSVESKYNYLELLEEICKFFGWSCRIYSTTVYFVAPDDQAVLAYSQFSTQDLASIELAQGTDLGSLSGIDFIREIYASTNNEVSLVQGVRECAVVADINKQDVVVDIPLDEILEQSKLNSVSVFNYGENGKIFTLLDPQYSNENYEFEDMVIDLIGGNYNIGASVLIKEYFEGDIAHKHNYSWEPYIEVRGAATPYCVSFSSKHPHNYDHGVFVISATTRFRYIADGILHTKNAQGTLTCQLRIGNNWWNGSEWVSSKPDGGFTIPIGNESGGEGDGAGQIFNNRELNGIYNEYNGHGIPITNTIGGVVDFQITDISLEETHGFSARVELTNIKMEFVREKAYAYYDEKSENEYKATNDSSFRGEKEINTIFATDNNNAFGLGIIMSQDGSYVEKITYEYGGGIAGERPEEHLAQRVSDFYSHTRKMWNVDVLHNIVNITPLNYATFGSDTAYPIAISNDWKRDIATIKLISL